MSTATARQVVRDEVSANPQVVLRMVRHGLERLGRRDRVRIRVNPKDAPVVEACLASRSLLVDEYELVEDGAVEVGGCLLESPTGSLDVRPTVHLDEIQRELLQEHDPRSGSTGAPEGAER